MDDNLQASNYDIIVERKRNKTLDCYKGVLIVLVVLGHIFEYSVSDWNHNILQNLIWAVQMPGFMLVSGYFSFKEVENGRKLMVGYRKSVERYLLPFLTWFILVSVLLIGGYGRNMLQGLNRLVWRVDRVVCGSSGGIRSFSYHRLMQFDSR